MALRLTAQYIEVAVTGAAIEGFRVEAQNVSVGGTIDLAPAFRVEAQNTDVGGTIDLAPSLRIEAQNASVAGNRDLNPNFRLTAIFLEVVQKNDHRGLTGAIGTNQSGLALDTWQLGAGVDGPAFIEPVNTAKLGAHNSLVGGHLQPGNPSNATISVDTGELGTDDSVLCDTMILASGAIVSLPSEKEGNATTNVALTDEATVSFTVTVSASNSISLLQNTFSSIKSVEASNTIVAGTVGDHNVREVSSVTAIALTQEGSPGLFNSSASSSLSLVQDVDSGVKAGDAFSTLSLSDTAVVPDITRDAFTTIVLSVVTDTNQVGLTANNTLALVQEVLAGGPKTGDGSNTIALTQAASFVQTAFGLVALSDLDIDGTWTQTIGINIFNVLALTPDALSDPPFSGFTDTWSSIPRLVSTFDLSASNTISLTQTLPQPSGSRSMFSENTLALLDFADTTVKTREASNTLSVTHEATFFRVLFAQNTISLTQLVEEGFISLVAESTISLQHTARPDSLELFAITTLDTLTVAATSSIRSVSAENTIDLVQSENVIRPYRISAINRIIEINQEFDPISGDLIDVIITNLTNTVTVVVAPNRVLVQNIPLVQQANVVLITVNSVDLAASNALNISQQVRLSTTADASSSLGLTQEADGLLSEDALTVIDSLQQAAVVQTEATLQAISELALRQSLGYVLERDRTDCDYSPFVGGTDEPGLLSPPRPKLPEPFLGIPESVRFRLAAIPFEDGVTDDIIDLRAPNFGNRERLQSTRINRQSAGGTLQVFADPMWPKVHQLVMQFSALKATQARALLDFIERHVGAEIGLVDHERRVWRVVITNPDEAIVQDGREKFSATLEMEASRVYQINRLAQTGIIVDQESATGKFFASNTLSVSQDADYTLFPVAAAANAVGVAQNLALAIVPAAPSGSLIPVSQLATGRNTTFRPQSTTIIGLGQAAASINLQDFGIIRHDWNANELTVGDGNPISTWTDDGTIGIVLNETGATRPLLSENALNGQHVAQFRHSVNVQRMVSASDITWFPSKTGTIFMVFTVREDLAASSDKLLMGLNPGAVGQTSLFLGGTGSTNRPVRFDDSVDGTFALETPTSVLANNSTHLFTLQRNTGSILFRRNGIIQDGATIPSNGGPKTGSLYFGGLTGTGNSFDMDIARCLVYQGTLDTDAITNVESILMSIYGI